jgi:CheY-like chemotaxis protein
LAGAHVLVVETNQASQDALIEMLTSWNIDATGANSAAEGLSIIDAAENAGLHIDAVIINNRLSDGKASEFVEILRQDQRFADLPVILVTPVNLRDLQATDGAGVQAHLLKPVRSTLLLSTLNNLLATRSVPAEPVAVRPVRVAAKPLQPGPALEVLVAEDNDINIMMFEQILSATQYRFKIVRDGEEAVEAWTRERPLVVLMDINMPKMDGFSATSAIRTLEDEGAMLRTPIIGVTAHSSEADREACLEAGMDDYLPKPINPDRLTDKIASWLMIAEGEKAGGNLFAQTA